jgi:pimeloyl-ACP methyl ester carboxylesterase
MKFLNKIGFLIFIIIHLHSAQVITQNISGNLSTPSGKYSVGRQIFQLEDYSRSDLLDSKSNRHIPVVVYYPTNIKSDRQNNYIDNAGLLSEMIANSYNHQDSLSLVNMAVLKTFSHNNAPIIKNKKFPLLLFSHGLGISSYNYTLFHEEYASQGYVVVAIEHPYGGFTILKNGQLASSRQDSLLLAQDRSYLLETIQTWSKDITFTLEAITQKNNEVGSNFAAHIDMDRIATIGHSLGGNAAVAASYANSKIKAAINMDGGIYDSEHILPHIKPILTLRSQPIYSEKELLQKGRNLEDWEKMGREIDASFSDEMSLAKRSYELKIQGAGHMSFSDAPYVLPTMITRFGGKIINREKGFQIIKSAITQFLEAIFNKEVIDFSNLVNQYSEVVVKIYKHN